RRRPADVRRRRRVRGRVRPPRVVQRLRTRPRGGGPRPGRSFAGAGGDRRVAGGHSPVVPVRLPCGGRQPRLSLGTGLLGLLTACWVRAELGAAPDRGRRTVFRGSTSPQRPRQVSLVGAPRNGVVDPRRSGRGGV